MADKLTRDSGFREWDICTYVPTPGDSEKTTTLYAFPKKAFRYNIPRYKPVDPKVFSDPGYARSINVGTDAKPAITVISLEKLKDIYEKATRTTWEQGLERARADGTLHSIDRRGIN